MVADAAAGNPAIAEPPNGTDPRAHARALTDLAGGPTDVSCEVARSIAVPAIGSPVQTSESVGLAREPVILHAYTPSGRATSWIRVSSSSWSAEYNAHVFNTTGIIVRNVAAIAAAASPVPNPRKIRAPAATDSMSEITQMAHNNGLRTRLRRCRRLLRPQVQLAREHRLLPDNAQSDHSSRAASLRVRNASRNNSEEQCGAPDDAQGTASTWAVEAN